MNNPFLDPQLEMKLTMDPRTKDFMNDPTFVQKLNILKRDPSQLNRFAPEFCLQQEVFKYLCLLSWMALSLYFFWSFDIFLLVTVKSVFNNSN